MEYAYSQVRLYRSLKLTRIQFRHSNEDYSISHISAPEAIRSISFRSLAIGNVHTFLIEPDASESTRTIDFNCPTEISFSLSRRDRNSRPYPF